MKLKINLKKQKKIQSPNNYYFKINKKIQKIQLKFLKIKIFNKNKQLQNQKRKLKKLLNL